MLRKFLNNRKGTAEVIGSVMFIIIIIFFFSSVYLWHDQATRQMNTMLSDKMNSPVSINWVGNTLFVNNSGGIDVVLSRLWVTNDVSHIPVELETGSANPIVVTAGGYVPII